MMKRLYIFALLCTLCVCAHAETVILRTGARVKGTIVFQNDDVVIIRNDEGARFQYPKTDVAEIRSDEETVEEEQKAQEPEEQEIQFSKKASILLELGVGAAVIPNGDAAQAGVGYNVDLLVGSHHIGDKHIFVGGGLGYHGMAVSGTAYNFLSIQAVVRMPFTEEKHAPVFGVGVGYGIALSKAYVGGLYAGVDFGYRCQVNRKTALAVVGFAHFQQAKMAVAETVSEDTTASFVNKTGRSLVTAGIKFALYF